MHEMTSNQEEERKMYERCEEELREEKVRAGYLEDTVGRLSGEVSKKEELIGELERRKVEVEQELTELKQMKDNNYGK